jgi:hypothetical protein
MLQNRACILGQEMDRSQRVRRRASRVRASALAAQTRKPETEQQKPKLLPLPFAWSPNQSTEHRRSRWRRARLLCCNRNFRRLWLAQIVSEIGDWFYTLSIYTLLLQLTGHASSVALALVVGKSDVWSRRMPGLVAAAIPLT